MTMLALLCTAMVGMAGGARLVSVLLAMFLAWAALQLGYFAGICAQGSWISLRAKLVPRRSPPQKHGLADNFAKLPESLRKQ